MKRLDPTLYSVEIVRNATGFAVETNPPAAPWGTDRKRYERWRGRSKGMALLHAQRFVAQGYRLVDLSEATP